MNSTSGTARRGLGRGLGALIPTTPRSDPRHTGNGVLAGPPVAGASFAEVPLDQVVPNPRQPRQAFDEDGLAELTSSVREVGLLQPVVVRWVAQQRYELVMGERRWRACRDAGLERIPAIVRHTDDESMLRDALLENLHRTQLNPLEEAAAYQQLLDDFGCSQDELATRLGRSRPQISNTLRLLRLPAGVARRVAAGVLSAGHARALLGLPDEGQQERLAERIVAEGLSVRTTEEIVAVGAVPAGEPDQVAKPVRRPVAPGLVELADRLSGVLDTRVRVTLGRRKGRIAIEFAAVDDLRRIVELIDPTPEAPAPAELTSDPTFVAVSPSRQSAEAI